METDSQSSGSVGDQLENTDVDLPPESLSKQVLWRPDIYIVAPYFVVFALVLVPYYNSFYRITVNLSHFVLFWISPAAMILILIPWNIYKHRFLRMLAVIALVLFMLWASPQAHDWRYAITNTYIKGYYCQLNPPWRSGKILGGIREIRMEGIERTGAFENASHCLIVACAEEFFYCDDAKITIGPY